MLKKIVFFNSVLVALFIGIAIGNTKKEPINTNPFVATLQRQQEKIDSLERENKTLSSDLGMLHRLLERDWRFLLREIDDSLDAVARDDTAATQESYTDWFGPTLQDLQKRGVGKWRLQIRINRLLALAEKGKYLSSYEHELVTRGGMDELRRDASEILK